MASSRGFTLIELLVVITVIVVLIALLAPALDEAIYQAELAVCGTTLKAVSTGVSTYALSYKRYYPDRGMRNQDPEDNSGGAGSIAPTALRQALRNFDMRDSVRKALDINKHLICPLNESVDLDDDVTEDESVAASYTMWWGWRYNVPGRTSLNVNQENVGQSQIRQTQANGSERGMFKLGDRFSWAGESFNLIAGDYDLWLGGGDKNPIQGSHPDDAGLLVPFAFKRQSLLGADAGGLAVIPITGSFYMRPDNTDRGLIDMNHTYDDGSVQRLPGVKMWNLPPKDRDERTTGVPNTFNQYQGWKYYQIPKR